MIYAKNVPTIERMIRIIAGFALVAFGLIGMKGAPLGYILAASGVVAVLTGFVGFCPMCALAGRRIQQNIKQQSIQRQNQKQPEENRRCREEDKARHDHGEHDAGRDETCLREGIVKSQLSELIAA